MDGSRLWMALVHHPVLDREGRSVTTSVTNLDVHDLARSARTYSLAGLVIVTPIEAQRRIVERIVGYWEEPEHAARIPRRKEALELVRIARDVEEAKNLVHEAHGRTPELVGTSARSGPGRISWQELRTGIQARPHRPRLILLGTGWGLADRILDSCEAILSPIEGTGGYNHLSVRSAGAVTLDRLLGSERPEHAGP
jgi:hypothetical protein